MDQATSADLRVAVDGLRFDAASYAAVAGEVEVERLSDGSQPHTLVSEGVDGFKLEDHDSESVSLASGDYVMFCDVPGHREAGMIADLTIS